MNQKIIGCLLLGFATLALMLQTAGMIIDALKMKHEGIAFFEIFLLSVLMIALECFAVFIF